MSCFSELAASVNYKLGICPKRWGVARPGGVRKEGGGGGGGGEEGGGRKKGGWMVFSPASV